MGLGNPGTQYASTRHNAGFRVLEHVALASDVPFRKPFFSSFEYAQLEFPAGSLTLVRPLTFMNLSGQVLDQVFNLFRKTQGNPKDGSSEKTSGNSSEKTWVTTDNFLAVVDQLDLPPGQIRLKGSGGHAGHNGLKSLDFHGESQNYKRLYIGIGRPPDGIIVPWVLGSPEGEVLQTQEKGEKYAASLLPLLVSEPWERVVHEFNRSRD